MFNIYIYTNYKNRVFHYFYRLQKKQKSYFIIYVDNKARTRTSYIDYKARTRVILITKLGLEFVI